MDNAELILNNRLEKLMESYDFISGVDTVNMKDYAKAAIRDIFIQMPTRTVNVNNWDGYKNYIKGFFGANSYKVAMRELKEDGWLKKDDIHYKWKKMFGPIGATPKKAHLNEWADSVFTDTLKIGYDEEGAYPFLYYIKNDAIKLGNQSRTHGSIDGNLIGLKTETNLIRGRIWTYEKILSLWEYPDTKSSYMTIIKNLNAKLKEQGIDAHINSSWKFDVPAISANLTTDNMYWNIQQAKDKMGLVDMRDVESYLIPVFDWTPKMMKNPEEYMDTKEMQLRQHIGSPVAKKSDVFSDIGSRKTPAGLSSTQRHQMKSTSENKLNESPDTIYIDNFNQVEFTDRDAYPFYYVVPDEQLYVSEVPAEDHYTMKQQESNSNLKYIIGGYYANDTDKENLIMGRIWIDDGILSFWNYPKNAIIMKQVVDDISEHFREKEIKNIDVWNNFDVEVIDDDIDVDLDADEYEDSTIIPVKQYKFSDNPPEDEYLQHVVSPVKKKQKDVATGIGSTKRPSGLSSTQRHQMKSTSESADVVIHPDHHGKIFFDWGAVAFGYYDGKMEISKYNETHPDILRDLGFGGKDRHSMEYPGRIWPSDKLISFWKYPKGNSEMKQIIRDLEAKLRMTIWEEPDYRIEIRKTANDTFGDFIKLQDFKESYDAPTSELNKAHVLSPVAKKADVTGDIGSKKRPVGLSSTQRHQMKTTSDGIIKLKDLLKSE